MNMPTDPLIDSFMHRYARATAAGDAETLGMLFAPTFLTAGPNGAQIVRASDLVPAIPKRRQMLESIGCQLPQLASVDDTPLDARYTLVRTQWRWRVVRGNDLVADLTLPSTFLVDRGGAHPQIVCYLPHQDITTVLRERGLLPP
jgi:hypothetical protein